LQNLQLLLHIPDLPSFSAETGVTWQLFDRQSDLLRDSGGTATPLTSVPRAERTVIVIPARRVVYIETPLPTVSLAKRDALLRYAIEDKLTIDPATVHAVVLGAAATGSNMHVVAAIDRAWFASAIGWLRGAGIEASQAVSVAALIPVSGGEWGLLLEGAHGLARRADGFAYSFDVDSNGKQDGGIPPDPPFGLALALKEARSHQVAPAQLTVFTDQLADAAWIDNWQRALDIPLRIISRPTARLVGPMAGNLLSGDFATRAKSSGIAAMLKPVASLLAVIASLQAAFIVIDAWRLDQRRISLEREMIQVFRDAFPQAQAIVDPPLQMQRNLDAMKRARGQGSADDARLLLAQLTSILSVEPTLVPQRVTLADGVASLDVTVPDAQMQSTLKARAASMTGLTFAVDADNVVRLSLKAAR